MEHQTGFDVERSLAGWVRELGGRPCYGQKDLQEIEDHLRESMAALRASGLSAEEAFLLARRRFGDGAALDAEFTKVNQRHVWMNRTLWMLVGVQAWALLWDFGGLARMAASWGLVRLKIVPVAGWVGSNGFLRSVGPGVLLAGLELALLAACVAALTLWVRGHQELLSTALHRVLGRTASAAFLALALLVLGVAVKTGMLVGVMTISRVMPLPQSGAIGMSTNWASFIITLAQLLTIPVLIVVLARRALAEHRGC